MVITRGGDFVSRAGGERRNSSERVITIIERVITITMKRH
jgi:hypothetical protein